MIGYVERKILARGVSGTGQTRNPGTNPTRASAAAPSPSPSPAPSSVAALACAVVRFRLRLSSLLASPRLVSLLASSRVASLFPVPSSSLPSPIFLPPVSRHLPPPFPVSVLPPYPVSLRGSASASPSSPSLSPLRLCFFLVGEAAVDIQLRRSLLSGSSSALPAVEIQLRGCNSGAPCSLRGSACSLLSVEI
ncbi:hypothetical protein ACLOJK_038027 [Asimina triloba]